MLRSQQLMKVAPKQSPAPVGSNSSTLNPGCVRLVAGVEVAGAFRAPLVNNCFDAVDENLLDGGLLFVALVKR